MGSKEKKNNHLINEVANIFEIPTSKIRYWEKKELLSLDRDEVNNYRVFNYTTLIQMFDILFYRNLGIAIKDLKNSFHKSPDTARKILKKKQNDIEENILNQKKNSRKIQERINLIDEFLFYKQNPDNNPNEPVDFDYVEKLDVSYKKHTKQYLLEPSFYVFKVSTHDDYSEGIIMEENSESSVCIFNRKETNNTFFAGILEVYSNDLKNNNLKELKLKMNYPEEKKINIISRYLTSGTNDQNFDVDYYKCWFY